jgi:hypothetical protein
VLAIWVRGGRCRLAHAITGRRLLLVAMTRVGCTEPWIATSNNTPGLNSASRRELAWSSSRRSVLGAEQWQ